MAVLDRVYCSTSFQKAFVVGNQKLSGFIETRSTSCAGPIFLMHLFYMYFKGFGKHFIFSVLLQEGGQCVVQSFLDATYFLCGDIKIHGLNSTPKEIQNAFTEAGYVIQRWESLTLDQECVFTDGRMLFSVVAKKV